MSSTHSRQSQICLAWQVAPLSLGNAVCVPQQYNRQALADLRFPLTPPQRLLVMEMIV
jgi:hypothetical protein